ncbi:MAG: hypothetical protein PHV95_04065 [Eubacteriales bacterium]|nr:hypothetical protein [Eubacteriales bacterium]
MSNIKFHESTKNIKTLDKAKDISKHMKNSFVKTKEKIEENRQIDYDTPHSYATESVFTKAKDISSSTAYKADQLGRRSLKKAPETLREAKTGAIRIKQRIHNVAKNIKTKRAVKAANNSKTVGKTAIKTVKTSKQTAQASVKTAQATLKASQKAAQTAKAVAKATAHTAKVTAKAVVATVKTTIAAVKGLITLIAAGGWVAIVVILVICMVGLLISSPFGIFFSSEKTNNPNDMTITSAIEQINNDFAAEIERIKSENPHDEVNEITTPQNWKDVIAIYAVKYSADPNNPNEVVTINNAKLEAVKSIFWDMNDISFILETIEPETNSSEQYTSNLPVSKKILHITVKNKNCSEMAAQYAFSSEQYKMLNELMSDKNKAVFDSIFNN